MIAPTIERQSRGLIERLVHPIADTAGAVGRPYRAIDILAAMERRGTITSGMRTAGENFRARFVIAHLNPLRAANIVRLGGGGHTAEEPGLKIEAAREHVWRAICYVGGLASPAGSVLWNVVGMELSIKEWALGQGWSGRRVSQESASGILIAALGVLEQYYEPRARNR